ncbi:MAG: nicotinate (nicotinamide) nucleotide adenylyltransferase [Candidatus Dormibacteria bacterium]
MAAEPPRPSALVLFGGTFDPVHQGHLQVVAELRRETGQPVAVLPSGVPGHRPVPAAPAQDRAEMVSLALRHLGDPGASLSLLEVESPGPSYTVETVGKLRRRQPGQEVVLALGADAAAALPTWRRPEELLPQVRLLVFDRRGVRSPAAEVLARLQRLGLPLTGARAVSLDIPDVDATEVRRRLAQGDPCSGLVLPEVLGYIRDRGLYGFPRDSPVTS